jgi:predicted O-methyltransferase YrrM
MTRVHPDLAAAYQRACTTVSDIHQHLRTLSRYASCCRHLTEFGTRTGISTLALLRAVPERLVAYDWARLPEVDTV